jgi:hypothetical protein
MESNNLKMIQLKDLCQDKAAMVEHLQNETDFLMKKKAIGEKLDHSLKSKILNS